jgi:hypothetical protein
MIANGLMGYRSLLSSPASPTLQAMSERQRRLFRMLVASIADRALGIGCRRARAGSTGDRRLSEEEPGSQADRNDRQDRRPGDDARQGSRSLALFTADGMTEDYWLQLSKWTRK